MQKPLNVKRLARNVNQNLSKIWTFVQKEKTLKFSTGLTNYELMN